MAHKKAFWHLRGGEAVINLPWHLAVRLDVIASRHDDLLGLPLRRRLFALNVFFFSMCPDKSLSWQTMIILHSQMPPQKAKGGLRFVSTHQQVGITRERQG